MVEQLAVTFLSERGAVEGQKHALTPTDLSGGFACDLILYDEQFKRPLYIYPAYGLGLDLDAMDEWRTERAVLSGVSPHLATLYFGGEVTRSEFVMIDPLTGVRGSAK